MFRETPADVSQACADAVLVLFRDGKVDGASEVGGGQFGSPSGR
ncbi:hypothetical protein [Bifidobacterium crudilactis]|nr:hypothetical protein [Bifidobacterium crudilactis]